MKKIPTAVVAPLLLVLLAPLAAAGASAAAPKEKEGGGKKKEVWSADTFAGLELRGIGPALTSGRIIDVAVHPKDRATWYVAAASGGVWKTVNAGTTWTPVFDDEGSYSIGCVAIDPNDPLVVWVGTGENNSQRSVSYGDGVYKSVDGGKSWKNVGLERSEHIGKIAIDPRDSRTVYVAAQGPLWSAGGDRGLYKTTDGGATWKPMLAISKDTGVTDVVFDPRDPDVLYAAAYQRRRHVWTLIDGGPESAIYKSRDGGATWTKLTAGLPKEEMGRIGLAVSPADPNTVYAVVEAARKAGGFFRSRDGGGNWEKRGDYVSGSPQYYQELVPDPADVDRIYSMDVWTQVSEDGGKTFAKLGEPGKHPDNHALWIDPADPRHLLSGGDGGLYESFDRGASWDFKANLPVTQFYRITADNSAPFYYVYGGTQDNFSLGGPARTATVHGITNADWFVTQGGDGFGSQVDPEDPDVIYAQSQYGGLVRFDRRSGEQVDVQPQPGKGEGPLRFNWDSPLLVSPHSHTRLYFAANKLFRSDDRGDSWRAVSPDLTRQLDRNTLPVMGRVWGIDAVAKNSSTSFYGNVVALSESPVVEGLIYAGTDDGLVQVTEDGGAHWRKVERFPGVPERTYVSRLEADRRDPDVVYAAFDNHQLGDFKPYLLKSADRGRTWTSIAGDLPARGTVYALAQDPADPGLLFAGTEFGLYFSNDGGARWVRLKGGMPTIAVRDLAIQAREGDLVVATFGRGVYVLDDLTPLRRLRPETLGREAVLFPVKRAWMYVPSTPLGVRGQGFQGGGYYTAPNPPFGAVFTYYLKDEIESRKKRRWALESGTGEARREGSEPGSRGERAKGGETAGEASGSARDEAGGEAAEAAEKSGERTGGAYPTWEELRAEEREPEPAILLTLYDEEGNVVRRQTGPVTAGFHRVAWDLRFPPSEPVELKSEEVGPFSEAPAGPLAAPGTYRVEIAKQVEGKVTPLGEAQTFTAVPLGTAKLAASDRAALLAFQRKVARLQRAVLGAVEAAGDAQDRLDHVQKALLDTPGADLALAAEARAIDGRLKDLQDALSGDKVVEAHNEPALPGIVDRVQSIVDGAWRSTSAPTRTHQEAYALAAEAFAPVLEKLRALIEVDLKGLEDRLESLGAPWTPGRVPVWKPE